MEDVLVKPKQSYVFDHKLTDAEIQELVDNYDYDLRYLNPDYDDESEEDEPIFDSFGNPTESTIRAMYESQHGIYETVTLEEAIAEIHASCSGD